MTRLAGLPVVDSRLARQAGVVSDALLDLGVGRVAALDLRHADGWLIQRVPVDYVHRIQHGAVLVNDSVDLDFNPPMAADARWLRTGQLTGLEVLGEGGDLVGHVDDVDVDARTLSVTCYLLRERRLLRQRKIMPDDVVSFSDERLIVCKRPPAPARRWRPSLTWLVPRGKR